MPEKGTLFVAPRHAWHAQSVPAARRRLKAYVGARPRATHSQDRRKTRRNAAIFIRWARASPCDSDGRSAFYRPPRTRTLLHPLHTYTHTLERARAEELRVQQHDEAEREAEQQPLDGVVAAAAVRQRVPSRARGALDEGDGERGATAKSRQPRLSWRARRRAAWSRRAASGAVVWLWLAGIGFNEARQRRCRDCGVR